MAFILKFKMAAALVSASFISRNKSRNRCNHEFKDGRHRLVYRSPNINEEDNRKLQNATKEVSKGECIIMGDFNHGHIQWKSVDSTGGEDQQFLLLIQESFLTQHVLEPTRGENVLDLVLSSQNSQHELVDNVKLHEPLGNSDHNTQ